jgi:hypothetical protein
MVAPRLFLPVFAALVCVSGAGSLACGDTADAVATSTAQALAEPSPNLVAERAVVPTPPLVAADHFQLGGGALQISYDRTAGVLVYQDALLNRTFSGSEVHTDESLAGTMVSVVTRPSVDTGSTTFSLLVPRVTLEPGASAPVQTVGIGAQHRFSVVRQDDLGQLDSYGVTTLVGTATGTQ